MIAYKLLNPDLTTYGECQWVVGEKKTVSGCGDLCGPGWLHGYEHVEIAHFLNPIHANFKRPVLYRVVAGGRQLRDGVLKSGWTEMTLLEPVDSPTPTIEQRVRFAIACAVAVHHDPRYVNWATRWLSGDDRSAEAAAEAWAAAAKATWAAAAWATKAAAAAAAAKAATKAAAAAAAAKTAMKAAWAAAAAKAVEAGDDGTLILQAAQFALSEATYPPWISGGDRL